MNEMGVSIPRTFIPLLLLIGALVLALYFGAIPSDVSGEPGVHQLGSLLIIVAIFLFVLINRRRIGF